MVHTADPKASYLAIQREIDQAIREVMASGWYILGPQVDLFEHQFATYLGTRRCIGVGNGTDAIQFALRALGVGQGDFVLTVSHTAVATVSAIDWLGAVPVLVDIDRDTYTISLQKVKETLQDIDVKRVKAIVVVHLYGHPADMDGLISIAQEYGLPIIEDCAQAHGAAIDERMVGSIGVCGAFSFYPTKNLGAFGDGGAIVTSDERIAERLRLLQQYGWQERYISKEVGYNSRLDELQAAVLNCKLKWLDVWNERRRQIAAFYCDELADLPIVLPIERTGNRHVFHQFVIRCADRDLLRARLLEEGVGSAILYPVPVHLQPGYRDRVALGSGGMAVSEALAKEIVCLPIYPELSDLEIEKVVQALKNYFN